MMGLTIVTKDIEVGDTVVIVDRSSPFFNQLGKIIRWNVKRVFEIEFPCGKTQMYPDNSKDLMKVNVIEANDPLWDAIQRLTEIQSAYKNHEFAMALFELTVLQQNLNSLRTIVEQDRDYHELQRRIKLEENKRAQ